MARSPLERRKGFLRRRDGDEAAKTDGLTGASIGKSAPLQCPLPSGQELALVPWVFRWKCLPSGGGWLPLAGGRHGGHSALVVHHHFRILL